ncbi:hypothetical protein H4582DRAFT_2080635 [Lactarius indigo]|nr:hypothetical protein H4582DRAFT_2080635 [Lactarius indigo]
MANAPLQMLASYTTPVQTQQSQPASPSGNNRNTPGQKRKRTNGAPQDPQEDEPPPPQRDPLPVYNLPRFNREHSAPPQPSPISEAQKRRKLQSQTQEERSVQQPNQEQEMAVDEDASRPAEQTSTPTPANSRRWYNDSPSNQPEAPQNNNKEYPNSDTRKDDVTTEVDEQENAKTLARLMATSERSLGGNPANIPTNPLDRYTEGPMPEIHEGNPMMLLTDLDNTQIQNWLDLPTGKVLARPFDTEVNYQPNHSNIAKMLLAAAKEITGATSAAVAAPIRDRNAPRGRGHRHPITFLIHDIPKKDAEFLLERRVWSSKDITFEVAPVNVRRPDFLFTIAGFTTSNPSHVGDNLIETWNDPISRATLQILANKTTEKEEQQNRLNQMLEFLDSVTVVHLDVRSGGGKEDPHFNIYANGEAIDDVETWLELREYLRSRVYKSTLYGQGRVKKEDFVCSLCHGRDHPRGLCPFPQIPGWNGGNRTVKRTTRMNQYRLEQPQNGQRNRGPQTPRGFLPGNA